MCCGALAMAPVPDGPQLGLELGQPQVWPVRLRMGLALLWEGALAGEGAAWAWLPEGAEEGELAEEGIQGGPAQAAASSKEQAVPVARKDPSEPSPKSRPPARGAGSSVPLWTMCVSCHVLRKPCR